ncbi:acyl-CoA dehydrogenase/oxidase [Penicillium hispanicum]|uniref:acyl-CoA dehydrogenase/oxidase n=1 Tax=Penicillium hispanicum TaxID=1080232 RepID=UPI00253F9CA2|nr:acyl-CoA dehydrogenase/oxidase [Penicillium hispanicum]KAJ5591626.1 acyl-CoA dehydrogenase/oxidase [Penicillium hispanicum]
MSTPSLRLARMEIFKSSPTGLTEDERIARGYEQARAMAREYQMTANDVISLTPKFWKYHQDLLQAAHHPPCVLTTIQFNLVAGTIGQYLPARPDLQELMDSILAFDVSAQFLLTEVGHGLDAKNLETKATKLSDGGFDLHSPTPRASKQVTRQGLNIWRYLLTNRFRFMPPTTPIKGFPRVGVVFARLVVDGEDRGVRPFIVWLNDGEQMFPGITSTKLPHRPGTRPIDHSVTGFYHVKLPSSALLGSLEKPKDTQAHFLSIIRRVTVGTLSLSTVMLPILKRAVYVAGTYSISRHINGKDGKPIPIIHFRTQQRPVLHALAQIAVLEAYMADATRRFVQPGLHPAVRHGIATALKAVVSAAPQRNLLELSDRCGAQGLYEHNHIVQSHSEFRGGIIAEGDALVLCISMKIFILLDLGRMLTGVPGLASELLLGRYKMPPARNPDSFIARHEQGLHDECQDVIRGIKADHRSEEFNNAILPRCQPLVEAIGNRMAYEAAVEAGIDPDLLSLFEAGVILQDSSWFVQHAGLTRAAQFENESRALNACLPRLQRLLEDTGAQEYVDAPILSQEAWTRFLASLKVYKHPSQGLGEDDFPPGSRSRARL